MSRERARRRRALFEAAAELVPSERAALLARECGDDAQLRLDVEALLHHDARPDDPIADAVAREAVRATAESQLEVGGRIGAYELIAKLGEGGMGVVWQALDTTAGREVALKVLPPFMAADPARVTRFRREARAIASLDHPNIVSLHSVEEAGGFHFLTMEYVDGCTLDRLIPAHGLPLAQWNEVARPLVAALVAAHERGVIHRDLKPGNIMVGGDGRLRVLDFGLAKLIQPVVAGSTTLEPTISRPGDVLGTLPYMSPEQLLGQSVDERSDIFSLGTVLFEMAAGQRPFRGHSKVKLTVAILRDPPPAMTRLRSDLPAPLARVIERCLSKEPEQRFQSVNEVHAALDRLGPGLDRADATLKRPRWLARLWPRRA